MKAFLTFCIMLIFFSCNNNKQQGLVYFNNFESIKGWSKLQLEKTTVHSGVYANQLDVENPYGETFELPFKEIAEQQLKKVRVKFWTLLPDTSVKAKLVIEINQPDKKNVFWIAKSIEDYVKTPGTWTEVALEFTLPDKSIISPENFIKIFPWNLGKQILYVDDFRIEFVI